MRNFLQLEENRNLLEYFYFLFLSYNFLTYSISILFSFEFSHLINFFPMNSHSSSSFSSPFPSDYFSFSPFSAFFLTFFISFLLFSFFLFLYSHHFISSLLIRKFIHCFMGPIYCIFWLIFPIQNENEKNLFSSFFSSSRILITIIPIPFLILFGLIGLKIIPSSNSSNSNSLLKNSSSSSSKIFSYSSLLVSAISRSGSPSELLVGPFFYGLIQSFSAYYYYKDSPIGRIIIGILSWGDGFSDIFGRNFGSSNILPWNYKKSFAGSFSFILFGFLCSAGLIRIYQLFSYFSLFSYFRLFEIVCLCSFVESISGPNWDNLTIFATVVISNWIGWI